VIAAIRERSVDEVAWRAFIRRHIGATDGQASVRFVHRFLEEGRPGGGDTLRRDVRHE
jgi:hypothetical protein